jgi:hypothetical protein
VTTRQLEIYDLALTDFPAVIIEAVSAGQSMLNNGQAEAAWLLRLKLYVTRVTGLSASENWREKSALINQAIASDRQIGGLALKAEITGRQQDSQIFEPWASGTLDLTIRYRFNELTQGG